MHRLHETQRDFSRFVFQQTEQLPFGIKANGLSAEQRLSIYRNNTRAGLTETLRSTYPVVNRLVGEDFFNWLAQLYIKTYPPRVACLADYGEQFADVIAKVEAAQGLPFLADTAKLEWLWHQAYHEADAKPLDISVLAKLDAKDLQGLGFKLHPTVRFMVSAYPIGRIWDLNQPDAQDESINLNEGGCQLLVARTGLDVEIISLTKADYQFLSELAAGLTLTQVVGHVLMDYPEFDVQSHLPYWLARGLLTGYFIV